MARNVALPVAAHLAHRLFWQLNITILGIEGIAKHTPRALAPLIMNGAPAHRHGAAA